MFFNDEIKTDHFKTMGELIKTCKIWIADDDYDAYCRFFEMQCMKALLNLIEKQDKIIEDINKLIEKFVNQRSIDVVELDKKDKIINKMAEWVAEDGRVGFSINEVIEYFEDEIKENK